MKTFVVYSDRPHLMKDEIVWVLSLPQRLAEAKVKDVRYKTAYCCSPDKKMIVVFEGPDKGAVSDALNKIGMGYTAVMEATKV